MSSFFCFFLVFLLSLTVCKTGEGAQHVTSNGPGAVSDKKFEAFLEIFSMENQVRHSKDSVSTAHC